MKALPQREILSPTQSAEDFSILDDLKSTKPEDKKFNLTKCVAYLCFLKEPSKILIDKRAANAANWMRLNSQIRGDKEIIFIDDEFIQILSCTCNYYYSELKAFLSKHDPSAVQADALHRLCISQLTCFKNIIGLIVNITNYSKSFTYKFHAAKGTKAILNYLDDNVLMKMLAEFKSNENEDKSLLGKTVIKFLIYGINNISLIAAHERQEFDEIEAKRVVVKFLASDFIEKDNNLQISAHMTLVNLVTDQEVETLDDAKNALNLLVKLINACAESIEKNDKIKRLQIDFEIDGENVNIEVFRHHSGFLISELISSVYRLVINDKTKRDLYDCLGIRDILFKLMQFGNDWEKMFALKLLMQLCFEKDIARKVNADNDLFSIIQNEVKKGDGLNKFVKKYCEGIIWSVGKLNEVACAMNDNLNAKKNHIMISYNRNSRVMCLRIKAELERLGHTVWIDVENIHGSTLASMANAIEESKCVLICMTEDYKQSVYCRAVIKFKFLIFILLKYY